MKKYLGILALLGAIGYYGFQELNKAYDELNGPKNKLSLDNRSIGSQEVANNEEVFYYILVDRFADGEPDNNKDIDLSNPLAFHGGDIKGVEKSLKTIKDLGVTTIVLNSITNQVETTELVTDQKLGKLYTSWPFRGEETENLGEIDPRFGTKQDLFDLFVASKEMGLKVFLSLNLNGLDNKSSMVLNQDYSGYFRRPESTQKCNRKSISTEKCIIFEKADFIHEAPQVEDYLLNIARGWARQGADGLLLRDAEGYSKELLAKLNSTLKQEVSPQFKIFAYPNFSKPDKNLSYLTENHADYISDFTIIRNISRLMNREKSFKSLHKAFSQAFNREVPLENVVTSIEGLIGKSNFYNFLQDEEKTKLAFTFQVALGGIPMIRAGEEVGHLNEEYPFDASDYPWGDIKMGPGRFVERNQNILNHYKEMITFRNKYSHYLKGHYKPTFTHQDEAFCFFKVKKVRKDKELVDQYNSLICFNMDDKPATVTMANGGGIKAWTNSKGLLDLLSGNPFLPSENKIKVSIPSKSAVILVPNN